MAERVREAVESAFVTKIVLGVCAFLGLGLLGWGGSSIYSTNVGQQLLTEKVTTLVATVDKLQDKLEATTSNRYDSNAAATQNAAMVELINTMNTNLTAMIGKALDQNHQQDEQLRTLGEFRARTEERLRMEDRKP